jgi:hypothetical protein
MTVIICSRKGVIVQFSVNDPEWAVKSVDDGRRVGAGGNPRDGWGYPRVVRDSMALGDGRGRPRGAD